MKCEICKTEETLKNKVICSEGCGEIRQMIFDLEEKYFPCNGCDNCWGDLHNGCSAQCRKEMEDNLEFGTDLWKLVQFIISKSNIKQVGADNRSVKGEESSLN